MKDEATPEQIAMARRIAAATRIAGPLGLGSPSAFRAALAAIIATTELAARTGPERAAASIGHHMVEFGAAHDAYTHASTALGNLQGQGPAKTGRCRGRRKKRRTGKT